MQNLATVDVIGCASIVVRHKIKNISANNEAMQLKVGRDQILPYVVPYGTDFITSAMVATVAEIDSGST